MGLFDGFISFYRSISDFWLVFFLGGLSPRRLPSPSLSFRLFEVCMLRDRLRSPLLKLCGHRSRLVPKVSVFFGIFLAPFSLFSFLFFSWAIKPFMFFSDYFFSKCTHYRYFPLKSEHTICERLPPTLTIAFKISLPHFRAFFSSRCYFRGHSCSHTPPPNHPPIIQSPQLNTRRNVS